MNVAPPTSLKVALTSVSQRNPPFDHTTIASPKRVRWERAAVATIATVAMALLFHNLWAGLHSATSFYGSARGPHSDAFQPWLGGTLSYYFHNAPTPILYRPSVGVIFSSILSTIGVLRIEAIPIFFTICLFVFLVFYFAVAPTNLAGPVALWLLCLAFQFGEVLAPLGVGTLQIDYPSWVITVSGILLLTLSFSTRPVSVWGGSAAFLLLGISAAIRGPLMLSGLIVLVGAVFLLERRRRWLQAALLAGCFALPVLVDIAIQRANGVTNNGVINCFAFYADPEHTWNPALHTTYQALKPTATQVLTNYLGFLFSPKGLAVLKRFFFDQLERDTDLLLDFGFTGVCFVAALVAFAGRQSLRELLQSPRLFVPALFLLMLSLFPSAGGWVGLLFLGLLIALSITLRLHYAAACLLTYVFSLLFLSLLGLAPVARLAFGTWFCLPLGLLFFMLQTPATAAKLAPPRALLRSSIFIIAVALWLYTANFLITTPAKSRFHAAVEGRQAALKIADEPRYYESLFYTGDGQLIYTLTDPTPIGGIREYRAIQRPKVGVGLARPGSGIEYGELPVIFR